jgi:hypothetical protein
MTISQAYHVTSVQTINFIAKRNRGAGMELILAIPNACRLLHPFVVQKLFPLAFSSFLIAADNRVQLVQGICESRLQRTCACRYSGPLIHPMSYQMEMSKP